MLVGDPGHGTSLVGENSTIMMRREEERPLMLTVVLIHKHIHYISQPNSYPRCGGGGVAASGTPWSPGWPPLPAALALVVFIPQGALSRRESGQGDPAVPGSGFLIWSPVSLPRSS